MKVAGLNSADMVSTLYEYTSGSTKDDDDSIASLLSSTMSSGNAAINALAKKAENQDYYKKALSAAENADELIRSLSDETGSVFAKAAETDDEEELAEYQTQATNSIASLLNAYNTMISNLSEAGGSANKKFLASLDQLMQDYGEELAEFGITQQEDGTLGLDVEALAGADIDALAAVFGPGADFAEQLTSQLDAIAEKTATTVNTILIYSTSYSNSGSYSQYDYVKGLYDLQA